MRKKMEKQMSKQGPGGGSDVLKESGSDDNESEEKKERKSVSGTSEKA